jgi:peptidoglycan/LPS O-acetylase OafA/YrhL
MSDQSHRDAAMGDRNVPMGYLRAWVTVLVVAHHSLIAYLPTAPAQSALSWSSPHMGWSAFPVLDAQRVPEFGLLIGINDVFFMSLMFFLSGLFVWQSLQRKGAIGFVRDRIIRLGVPFAVAASLLAPLAYFPSYLQNGGAPEIEAFLRAWLALPAWPAGPAWFLWVLLVFGTAAAFLYALWPRFGDALGRLSGNSDRRPLDYVLGLIAVSGAGYLGMTTYLGYDAWVYWGAFFVQAGRILLYATYFFAGIGVGAYGLERGLLAADGLLARRWWLWFPGALMAWVALAAAFVTALGMKFQPLAVWQPALAFLFAVACAGLSFACVAFFVRFFQSAGPVMDSLSRNAYGVYLLHYAFATWIQFALLHQPLSGLEKGGIVFAATLALSWATTAMMRRFPTVERII